MQFLIKKENLTFMDYSILLLGLKAYILFERVCPLVLLSSKVEL